MYKNFFTQLGLSAIAMYLAMYAMIASLAHFVVNLNMIYMTLLMVAPMAVIMLLFMQHMYKDKRTNAIIVGMSALIFVLAFFGIRTQTPIGDAELARAMIPHHSGAILMCDQADLKDAEITELCRAIIESQKQEIAQMQAWLTKH